MEGVSAEVLEKLEELAEEWKPRTEKEKNYSAITIAMTILSENGMDQEDEALVSNLEALLKRFEKGTKEVVYTIHDDPSGEEKHETSRDENSGDPK